MPRMSRIQLAKPSTDLASGALDLLIEISGGMITDDEVIDSLTRLTRIASDRAILDRLAIAVLWAEVYRDKERYVILGGRDRARQEIVSALEDIAQP